MTCGTDCQCGGDCGCNSQGRRFLTTEEKLQKLNEYKDWLDSESKGVEEAIEKLKKTK